MALIQPITNDLQELVLIIQKNHAVELDDAINFALAKTSDIENISALKLLVANCILQPVGTKQKLTILAALKNSTPSIRLIGLSEMNLKMNNNGQIIIPEGINIENIILQLLDETVDILQSVTELRNVLKLVDVEKLCNSICGLKAVNIQTKLSCVEILCGLELEIDSSASKLRRSWLFEQLLLTKEVF
ncbi:hypothetical protein HK096_001886 [Nowakowskiella sp. JEL0078]|nr:hypothetical protein HK096_001886 [Nowakowskiella sp. JEL0078]